ncbi:hypothetical protein [Pseudoxanthomonas suwonensis]|jgi:hypothetical protein
MPTRTENAWKARGKPPCSPKSTNNVQNNRLKPDPFQNGRNNMTGEGDAKSVSSGMIQIPTSQ